MWENLTIVEEMWENLVWENATNVGKYCGEMWEISGEIVGKYWKACGKMWGNCGKIVGK